MDILLSAFIVTAWAFCVPEGIWSRDMLRYAMTRAVLPKEYFNAAKWLPDFVVTLTTSPQRLKTLDLSTFSNVRVVLTLPELFRNEEPYDPIAINGLLKRWPLLEIHRVSQDPGPQAKLLGALELVGTSISSSDYLVVIDDDVAYSSTLLEAYNSVKSSHCVMAAAAQEVWGLKIAPGYASFCFRAGLLPKNFAHIVQGFESQECKRHDDMLFGAAFASLGIPIQHVSVDGPLPLPSGFGIDALHVDSITFKKDYVCATKLTKQLAVCPL